MDWRGRILAVLYLGTIATMFALSGISSYADIPREELVGAWLFDEGRGDTVEDISGNGNDMTIAAGTSKWGRGKFDMAMKFDGETVYLAAPVSPSLKSIEGQDAMSIVAWVKMTDVAGAYIAMRPLVYCLAVTTSGSLSLYVCTQDKPNVFEIKSYRSVTKIKPGEWVHLALVYDGEELRGYINGKEDKAVPAKGDIASPWNGDEIVKLMIGGFPGLPDVADQPAFFDGSIDEVGLFKTALTESQIRQIMRRGLMGPGAAEPKGKLATTWGAVKRTRQVSRASSNAGT